MGTVPGSRFKKAGKKGGEGWKLCPLALSGGSQRAEGARENEKKPKKGGRHFSNEGSHTGQGYGVKGGVDEGRGGSE